VVVRALVADAAGALEESVTWFVFPDGCRDAVQLTFATPDLHLAPLLTADARAAADNLSVTARPA